MSQNVLHKLLIAFSWITQEPFSIKAAKMPIQWVTKEKVMFLRTFDNLFFKISYFKKEFVKCIGYIFYLFTTINHSSGTIFRCTFPSFSMNIFLIYDLFNGQKATKGERRQYKGLSISKQKEFLQ